MMEGLKWNHDPNRKIGTAKVNEDGSITCTIDKVSNNENRKLKYPRKRVIRTTGYAKDIQPIIDFAEKYKRGERSRVIVNEYSEKAFFITGKIIPKVSVTFYSYEPVGQLRKEFRDELEWSNWSGKVVIEGWAFFIPESALRKRYGLAEY